MPNPVSKFYVISVRDEYEFDRFLNSPPDGYAIHSWNVVQVEQNYFQYVMVFKLVSRWGEI